MGNCPVSLNLHRRGAGHKRIHDRNVRAGRRVVSVENGVYTNRKAISVRPLVRQPPTTSLYYKKVLRPMPDSPTDLVTEATMG
ncbi:hypothetical protein TNIN_24091 [Trichonephila inaurata madagascariensis]|uniref:Uncharacterized protein n=1 Tax=Trichonephila inaurata madagascariensis TaxID=2747483 RepID=A0A8X7CN27_9ARAC|nr:hypothetical protein TNIN_24091 [Trichonephila inaurata madagascariensis]